MIADAKLDFWIKNNYNVLFIGKHGVGKTASVVQAFNRANLKWKYFSASTIDVWTDVIGIPKEKKQEDGTSYLDFVRPKDFANDEVEAIFFDEYNRSVKKTRNAVMELIQFKSINGKKFNNLRVVWAAINPDDDEDNSYDVEVLDPAQLDRFQVHVQVPYLPSEKFFAEKYGTENSDAAISWWKDLPDDMKNEISPRRLDYALDMYQKEGDLRDILPAKSNISKLKLVLESGPIQKQINEAIKTPENAKKFISSENNYAASILHIIKETKYMEVFLPLITPEKLSSLLIVHENVRDHLTKNAAKQPIFSKVISDVIQANQSKKIVNKLKRMLSAEARQAVNSAISGVPYITILKGLKASRDDMTPYRERIYNQLKKEFPQNPSAEEAIETLNILADKVISRTHPNTIGHMCPGVERIIPTCLTVIAKKDSINTPAEVITKYNPRWEVFNERLNRKVKFRSELLLT